MIGNFTKCFVAIGLLISSVMVAHSQSSGKDSFFVRANVLVTDDAKNYVNDLTKDDFILSENGVVQPITHFSNRQEPINVSILADNSGSMRDQLKVIGSIGKMITANLSAGDEAQLIRFIGRDRISTEQEWTSSAKALNSAFDGLFIEGGQSAVVDAIYLAAEDIIKRYDANKNRRYAIVLISDCEDRDSYYTRQQLFKLIGKRNIPIHVVALLGDFPRLDLVIDKIDTLTSSLASQTGGRSFLFKPKAKEEDFQVAIRSVLYELRSQYVVGYEAKNVTKDTAKRTIKIAVKDSTKGEKRNVTSRTGFQLSVD